jgi:methionyl-tRNA formyltransferase
MLKVIFMGTPEFSVGILAAIIEAGHEVVLAVTQPDKPKGRGKEMQFPAVKECAQKYGIPVFQPIKIKTEESVSELRKYPADIFVVAAFGQILSSAILHMPKYGCINVHASLLPKYRGAAPIQWAVINGEKESGVTIMQMNEGLDTGDMLLKVVVPLYEKETGESLHDKLQSAGADLCVEALSLLEQGKLHGEPQRDEEMTYAKMLTKELGHIDFKKSAREIERLIRGLNSWPSAFTKYQGKNMKIWDANVVDGESAEPGIITEVTKNSIVVATGDRSLAITELQLEGKKRMSTEVFLLGYQVEKGIKLDE